MIKLKYVCIARDEQDKKLVSVCTGHELTRGVRKACLAPKFHKFLLSIFALHPTACSVEVMDLSNWQPGVDVETLPWLMTAKKTEETRALSPRALVCSFAEATTESAEVVQCV